MVEVGACMRLIEETCPLFLLGSSIVACINARHSRVPAETGRVCLLIGCACASITDRYAGNSRSSKYSTGSVFGLYRIRAPSRPDKETAPARQGVRVFGDQPRRGVTGSSCLAFDRYNLIRLSRFKLAQQVGPCLQCGLAFGEVIVPVVDADNAFQLVIQATLGNVRRN